MRVGLCANCKKVVEVVYTDLNELDYCGDCVITLPVPSVARALGFLVATIPYRVGDRVECRLGGVLYEGRGHVVDISFDLKDGGSPVFPAFKVAMDERAYPEVPSEVSYTETCLRRIPEGERV